MKKGQLVIFAVVVICSFFFCGTIIDANTSGSVFIGSFADVYEPSAVIQLQPGLFLIGEDEVDKPLHLFEVPVGEDNLVQVGYLEGFTGGIDDLEGAARGEGGQVFLITSHSSTKKGKRKQEREQLVRLKVKGRQILHQQKVKSLLPDIRYQLATVVGLHGSSLEEVNVEGLSFDASGQKLLLGLRTPLYGSRSIVLVIENPYALFDNDQQPHFGKPLIFDMGGGIRAMTYDHRRGSYLLANEAKTNKGKRRSMLWEWDGRPGNQPVRIRMPKFKGVDNVEGVAVVSHSGKEYILLVCDDGKEEARQGAHYILISRDNVSY